MKSGGKEITVSWSKSGIKAKANGHRNQKGNVNKSLNLLLLLWKILKINWKEGKLQTAAKSVADKNSIFFSTIIIIETIKWHKQTWTRSKSLAKMFLANEKKKRGQDLIGLRMRKKPIAKSNDSKHSRT